MNAENARTEAVRRKAEVLKDPKIDQQSIFMAQHSSSKSTKSSQHSFHSSALAISVELPTDFCNCAGHKAVMRFTFIFEHVTYQKCGLQMMTMLTVLFILYSVQEQPASGKLLLT